MDHSSSSGEYAMMNREIDGERISKTSTDIVDIIPPSQDPDLEEKYKEVEVPDGGYGWFVVIAVFLFNFATWGANAAYAVYLAHYLNNDVFPGVTKIEYGVVGGLKFSAGMFFAPFFNYASGKIGIHAVMGVGIFLLCVSLLLASWATKFWQLALTQGFLNGIGMAIIAVSAMALLPQWFRKKRSLAQGLVSAGSGMGGVTFVLGLQHIISVKDYNWALRVEAIVCTVAATIGLLLTRTRSKHVKPQFKIVDKECFNFGHLLIILWIMFTMLGYVVLLYNLGDFTESLGYSAHQSSIVSTMISVGGFFFRPVVGKICDRYGPVTVSIIVHALVAIFSWAMWIPARNLATAIAFALMEGALMGTVWVVVAPMTTRVVGLSKTGTCLSNIWIFTGTASLISPIIGLRLKTNASDGSTDPTQYVNPAIFVGLMYFAASVSLFLLRGWIIARDDLMLELQEEGEGKLKEDTGMELHITVPIQKGAQSCFKSKPIRKV